MLARPHSRVLRQAVSRASFVPTSATEAAARATTSSSGAPSSSMTGSSPCRRRPFSHYRPLRAAPDPQDRRGREDGLQRSVQERATSIDPRERLRHARPLVSNAIAERFMNAGRGRTPRSMVVALVAAAAVFYFLNSERVPVTGRRRFNFLPDWLVSWKHRRAAAEIIRQVEEQGGWVLPERDWRTRKVQRVMDRLIPVSGMADLNWEVFVIADNATANAFVLPGGKVFVHSGILEVCGDDDALAAVLGHEVAHTTASHAAERMSSAWTMTTTMGSLCFLAGAMKGLALFGIWMAIGGLYVEDVLFHLPMSRQQEIEADYVGLMMMAEACYNPTKALWFWRRMEVLQRRGGVEMPEILSTHPSNQYRIDKITEWMAKAKEKQSTCQGTTDFAKRFREALKKGQIIVA